MRSRMAGWGAAAALACAGLFLAPAAGGAQAPQAAQARLQMRPHVGVLVPISPLVLVNDGQNPSITLTSAPSVGVDVNVRILDWLGVYAGVGGAFTQVGHSSLFVLREPARNWYGTTVMNTTVGLQVSMLTWLPWYPVVRAGGGAKMYHFDFAEHPGWSGSLTGDLGLGLRGGTGNVQITVDGRFLPSKFDPSALPMRLGDEPGQLQKDLVLQVGLQLVR